MTEAKHAPGPWEYNDPAIFSQGHGRFSETAVYAPGNAFPWRMAEIQGPDTATEIATARLIAAAPDMLNALELAEQAEIETDGDWHMALTERAQTARRAAIAKATGAA